MNRNTLKTALRFLLAALMTAAGAAHLVRPEPFVKMVPDYLPWPLALVYVSGVCEILGGVGLLIPLTTRLAAWGLVALYVAVFPANLNMALHNISVTETPTPPVVLWLRLPLQLVLIAWAWWYTRPAKTSA